MKSAAIGWAAIAAAFGLLALVGLGYANKDLIVLAVTFGGVALGISCVAFIIDWARMGAGPAAEEDTGSATEAFLVILGAIIIEGSIAFFFSPWYWLWVASPLVLGIVAAVVTRR